MKNLTIILSLMIFSFFAKAQTEEDRKSGKYLKSTNIENFIGTWVSNEKGKELEFIITTKKTHFKYKEYDYYSDPLYIEVIKCMYKGEDIAEKLNDPIMLTGNLTRYGNSLLKDPITGDEIRIKLYFKDKNSLKLNVNTMYSPGTSTIFPLGDTMLVRKK